MEKFIDNSKFSIYIDKKNEIVDFYNKVNNLNTRHMIRMIDEAIVKTASFETLLRLKEAIDIEINKRIDNGETRCLKN